MAIDTIVWEGDEQGTLRLIEQTLLPAKFEYLHCHDPETVRDAIRRLAVRGAPAIGVAAAYGAWLGARSIDTEDRAEFDSAFAAVLDRLGSSRPTAVNLMWAIERIRGVADAMPDASVAEVKASLFAEARKIDEQDRDICRELGRVGAALVSDGDTLLTHCNAGGLATADYGTALAVFYAAQESGKTISVFADETRPLLQGARLTAWELHRAGIDVTLICDSMAGSVMREGKIDAIFVGADRIAGNGDVANKIGTYPLAVLAREHDVPFYVVAPTSTFDLSLESGDEIPIEERDPAEITEGFGPRTAPDDAQLRAAIEAALEA